MEEQQEVFMNAHSSKETHGIAHIWLRPHVLKRLQENAALIANECMREMRRRHRTEELWRLANAKKRAEEEKAKAKTERTIRRMAKKLLRLLSR